MSQQAALMYCKWLYEKTGTFYRLPTEAEWEYACRAGSARAYPTGIDRVTLGTTAYFVVNSNKKFHKTGELKPNAWGLFDMLGNLSEWTLDQYLPDAYANSAGDDPLFTPSTKYPRVVRGGSYLDEASAVNCSVRTASNAIWNQRDPQIPKSRWWLTDGMFVGFRIVQPVKQPTEKEAAEFYAQYLK
ncbi:MAG: formylglycine-generating enzyme family protein [Bacteroidia bacterium]|nr:formylglycine-generating enzyme family protein [Bacteroidia bacterium]